MNRKLKMALVAVGTGSLVATTAACTDEATTVEDNMTTAADNFEVLRRVVFINGITDQYILTIEGFCSVTDEGNQVEVLCKVGEDQYTKDMLGLSDNVTYLVEQLEAEGVDPFHRRIMFRPEAVLPEFDLETSGN